MFEECGRIISDAWVSYLTDGFVVGFMEGLDFYADILKNWNKDKFKDIPKCLKKCHKKLADL